MSVLQMIVKGAKGKQALPFSEDDDAETAVAKLLNFSQSPRTSCWWSSILKDADYTLDYQSLTNKKQKIEPPLKIGNTFVDTTQV